MYYQPKLANGKLVQNPWNLRAFRVMNQIGWPLEDDAGFVARFIDRFYWTLGCLIFTLTNEAELRYLIENIDNIDEMLSGVPTYLVLVETHLRAFQLGLVKENFKQQIMKKFYTEIYIQETENVKICAEIQQKLRSTSLNAVLYFLSFFLLISKTIMNFAYNIREPLYKMSFVYDVSADYIFYTIVVCNLWVGFVVITHVFGELALIGQILLHLNGRFEMLGEDLQAYSKALLAQKTDPAKIAYEFQLKLAKILERNVELYKFAVVVQSSLSYRFFIWFAFSAMLLCSAGFKFYINPNEGVAFLFWCCSKLLELGSIGEIGSTLLKTTNEVSLMYYESNWELIVEYSTNKRENVRLMKMIFTAMETSHNPINLTGLNFFSVSLTAVMAIIQAAGSYFTCLIALR